MPFPTRSEKRLGEILVELCLISPVQIHRVLKKQDAMSKSKGYKIRLGEMLLREKMIDDTALAKGVGEQYGIDYLNLSDVDVSLEEMASFPLAVVEEVPFLAIKRGAVDLTIAISEEPDEEVYRMANASHSGDIIFVSSPKSQLDELREEIIKVLKSGKKAEGTINLSRLKGSSAPPEEKPDTSPGELVMPLPVAKSVEGMDPYLSSGDALDEVLPMPTARDAALPTQKVQATSPQAIDAPSLSLPSTAPPPLQSATEPVMIDPLDMVPDDLAFTNSFADAQSQAEIGFDGFPSPLAEPIHPLEPVNPTRSNIPVHPPQPPAAPQNLYVPEGVSMEQTPPKESGKSSGTGKMNSHLKDILIQGIERRATSLSFCHNNDSVSVYSKGATTTDKLTEISRPDFGGIVAYLEQLLKCSLHGMSVPVRKKVKLKLGSEAHLFQFLFAPTTPVSMNINILDNSQGSYSFSSLSLGKKYIKILQDALTTHHGLTIISAPPETDFEKLSSSVLNYLGTTDRKILYFGDRETPQINGLSQVTIGNEYTDAETAFNPSTLKTFLDSGYENIVAMTRMDSQQLKRLVNIALSETNTTVFVEASDCLSAFMTVKKTGVSTSSLIDACNFIINFREVQAVCPFCKETFIITKDKLPPNLQAAKQLVNLKAYRGKGCKLCKNTGISGKTMIFETMEVDSGKIDIDALTRTQKPLKKFLLESGLLQPFVKGARTSLMSGRITFDEFLKLLNPS